MLNSVLDQTYRKKIRKCCDVISGNVYCTAQKIQTQFRVVFGRHETK